MNSPRMSALFLLTFLIIASTVNTAYGQGMSNVWKKMFGAQYKSYEWRDVPDANVSDSVGYAFLDKKGQVPLGAAQIISDCRECYTDSDKGHSNRIEFSSSDSGKIVVDANGVIPVLLKSVGLSGNFSKKKSVTVQGWFGSLHFRELNPERTVKKILCANRSEAILWEKAWAQGKLFLVRADIVVDAFEVKIHVDREADAGVKAEFEKVKGNIQRAGQGGLDLVIKITRPVVIAKQIFNAEPWRSLTAGVRPDCTPPIPPCSDFVPTERTIDPSIDPENPNTRHGEYVGTVSKCHQNVYVKVWGQWRAGKDFSPVRQTGDTGRSPIRNKTAHAAYIRFINPDGSINSEIIATGDFQAVVVPFNYVKVYVAINDDLYTDNSNGDGSSNNHMKARIEARR